jgi:hypothetical protein
MVQLVTIGISITIVVCGLFLSNKEANHSPKGQRLIFYTNAENSKPWTARGKNLSLVWYFE